MSSWDDEEEDEALIERPARAAAATPGRSELFRAVVVRLYYSQLTAFLYLATMVLAAVLLCVTLGMDSPLRDAPRVLLFLEGLVTASLVLEVALRAVVLGASYLKSWSNAVDCIVAVLSAGLFFFAAPSARGDEAQKEDIELSQSLVMARVILQFGRVLVIASHARRARQEQSAANGEISFSQLTDLIEHADIEKDFDFSVLRAQEMQDRHRQDDFGFPKKESNPSWDNAIPAAQMQCFSRTEGRAGLMLWEVTPKSRNCEKSVEFEDELSESEGGSPRRRETGASRAVSSRNGSSIGSASLRQVSQATLDSLISKPSFLEDQEFSDVDEQEFLGRTESKPFAGHPSFKGPFSAEDTEDLDATRAGFYSIMRPPEVGDEVVCFQQKHWLQRGIVQNVREEVSNGQDGLKADVTGALVTVKQQDGSLFYAWAVFLATASDQEYSSVCLQAEFENSNFFKLRRQIYGDTVTHQTRAKASLEAWLQNCIDADGNAVEISPEMRKELLDIFDSNQEDPSLHLYSLHKRLGPRTDARKGRDYSLYYQALNNTLNHDTEPSLRPAYPLIRRMTYLLLYDEKTGEKRLHEGGRVWKGDSERPVPLNKQRLKLAFRHQVPIRFRQFQSTTSDQKVAARFQKREAADEPGGQAFFSAMECCSAAVRREAPVMQPLTPPSQELQGLQEFLENRFAKQEALLQDLARAVKATHFRSKTGEFRSAPQRTGTGAVLDIGRCRVVGEGLYEERILEFSGLGSKGGRPAPINIGATTGGLTDIMGPAEVQINEDDRGRRGSARHSFFRTLLTDYAERAQAAAEAEFGHVRGGDPALHTGSWASRCSRCAYLLVTSTFAAHFIMALILLNLVLLGVEVDVSSTLGQDDIPRWFDVVNVIIVSVFTLELIMSFVAFGFNTFFCGPDRFWNIFDFVIITLSVFETAVQIWSPGLISQMRYMRFMRLARALRGMRVVRLLRYVSALRTLIFSIIHTTGSLMWTLVLLVLLFYSFGVILTQVVTDHCRFETVEATGDNNAVPICDPTLALYWSSVPESMLTLFMSISGGIRSLTCASFCHTAIESASADKEIVVMSQMQKQATQISVLRDMFMEMDKDLSEMDVFTLFMIIDSDHNGLIDLHEFVTGCMQLHGPAKSIQLARMSHENKVTRQTIKRLINEIVEMKEQLAAFLAEDDEPTEATECPE
eukprot:s79_g3.t1